MVVRRKHKGPKRVQKDPLVIPAEIKLERGVKKLGVHIYRTDRDNPHSLAISFHIDPKTVRSGHMCIVVYGTLREAMQNLIVKPKDIDKDRGKHRSKPRRIPGKQREFRMLHSSFLPCRLASRAFVMGFTDLSDFVDRRTAMVTRKKKRMAVDPGTQKIGWAIGPVRVPRGKHGRVKAWGGIKIPKGDWLDRTSEMLKRANSLFFIHRPNEVIIEMPRSWDTGRGVGAKASGAILKLMFFVGCLVERAQVAGARVGLLGAGIWQGQLPKSVIYDRMNRRYELDFPSDEEHWDISDAIGMLHYSPEMARKIKWLR